MTYRKKLIEVALPLKAINEASAREKSIRHGHPSTLHLWWARRPLAAARAVIFSQIVNDPSSDPDYIVGGKLDEEAAAAARAKLFNLIEELVLWENTTNEEVLIRARAELARAFALDKLDAGQAKDTVIFEAAPSSPRGFGPANRTVLWDFRRRAATPEAVRHFLANHAPGFHDPFAGGGALPLEAQRLGLTSYASDLNPVAVLINKAMIEIPPKFAGRPPVNPESRKDKKLFSKNWRGAQGLAEDVRYYGQWMRDEAEKRIGHLYPKIEVTAEMAKDRPDLKPYVGQKLTAIAWLWARTVKSPNPAYRHVDVPLASTFMLSTKPGKEAWVEPLIEGDKFRFTVKVGKPKNAESTQNGTKLSRGANFQCVMSKAPIAPEHIYGEAKAGRMNAKLMAIVAEGERGRVYLAPTPEHEATALEAKPTWKPDLAMPDNPRWFSPPLYGLKTYGDLFTARQLVALTTFSDLVQEARERIKQDAAQANLPDNSSAVALAKADNRPLSEGGTGPQAYADALAVYLAFAISKASQRNNELCTWEAAMDRLGGAFGRQAIPMTWDFAETNPLSGAGGDIYGTAHSLCEVLDRLMICSAGSVFQADAQVQDLSRSRMVSTDPPYYDNIGYADLSDFFYLWLRRTLCRERLCVFGDLFKTVAVPKAAELVATPYRHGSKEKAENFFLDGMSKALGQIASVASTVVPVTIYYAFKQSEKNERDGASNTGWATFLDAVIVSGFTISGTWPVRTELTVALKKAIGALASSIVLVCRPRRADAPSTTRGAFVRALHNEMPAALRELQAANIAPVDLPQSCIGPGMAIFTRYKAVLNQDDTPMKVREALQLINEAIDNFFSEQEADYDAETRFALSWFVEHAFNDGPYGEADNLARARNVSVDGVEKAGILKKGPGKVRLLRRDELPKDWDPAKDSRAPVWECLQHLVRELEAHGETGAAALAGKLSAHQRALARELAYRLYTTCERKKQAGEAKAYNELITAWPELERLAAQEAKPAKGEKKDLFN